jgi:hypothetical protein
MIMQMKFEPHWILASLLGAWCCGCCYGFMLVAGLCFVWGAALPLLLLFGGVCLYYFVLCLLAALGLCFPLFVRVVPFPP